MILTWCRYDPDDQETTAPSDDELVWLADPGGVTVGYFDGSDFWTFEGNDVSVSWWAPITYPQPPEKQ